MGIYDSVWLQAFSGGYFLSKLRPPTASTLVLLHGAEQAQQRSPAHSLVTKSKDTHPGRAAIAESESLVLVPDSDLSGHLEVFPGPS